MGKIAAIGMFDGVHLGHRYLLERLRADAQSSGEKPLVVTFSNHPLEIVKPEAAPRLLTTPEEKCRLLADAGIEVVLLPFDATLRGLTAEQFMRRLRDEYGVTTLYLGFNNRFGSDRGLSADDYRHLGERLGIEVVIADESPGIEVSSSIVRQRLAEGDVAGAAKLLGREYELTGKVVEGNQIGRTIGFPTINLQLFDPAKILPKGGVYAAEAILEDGSTYPAVVNIGHRPTVDNSPRLRIEAFLDGFSGDLYGQAVTLRFIHYLRPERRFPSLDALHAQITLDLAQALIQIRSKNTPELFGITPKGFEKQCQKNSENNKINT